MPAFVNIQPQSGTRRKAWYRSPKLLRHGVMLVFFVFLLQVAYQHQVCGGGPQGEPSVEAYCPFGGIETLYYFLTTGGFVRRIEPSALILLGLVLLLTLVFSRGFCGWICPFGSLQEWIGLPGRKLFGKRYNPAGRWDRVLRLLKYVLLAAITGLTWHLGVLVFRDYDPFLAFFHLGQGVKEMPWAYAALGVVLLGSLRFDRFFCKYACPLGAVLGILGRFGLTRIRRDESGCKGCNICQKKCFAHVDFLSASTIRDPECNHCLDCVVECPRPNVLTVAGRKRRFSHVTYAAALLGGLFALVGATKLYGSWRTKPAMVSFYNAAGALDPGLIRGWMSLADISAGCNIPLERLRSAAGLPATVDPKLRINKIGETYHLDFEPEKLRQAVTAHLSGKPAADRAGERKGEQEIRGFMTLNQVSSKTGVPKEFLLRQLQVPAGKIDPRKPIRDWIHYYGKAIGDVRDAVAAYRSGKR